MGETGLRPPSIDGIMGGTHEHHDPGKYAAPPDPNSVREERQPAQDEAVELAPGIIRIQLPISLPGLGHVNCYAMPDDQGVTLVDPGLPGPQAWKELKVRLHRADIPVAKVHTVVVTHSHPDHFGQAGRLLDENEARVITHRSFRTFFDPDEEPDEISLDEPVPQRAQVASFADAQASSPGAPRRPWGGPMPWGTSSSGGAGGALRGGPRGPGRPPLKRRLQYRMMRMVGGRMGAVPRPTHRVDDADRVELGGRSWVSLHTPGHTNDHLCLFDPEAGILMSGDHVLPTITPHISGIGVTIDPLTDFFHSLERVGELDGVTAVLPAHGLEFTDLAGRAEAIRKHHEERLDLLRAAADEFGWATVPQYSTKLFPPRSLGQMADSETYAHLEHLRLVGEAQVRDDGPELLYSIG
jgi:glyoxylase-like metal-dependent hydrolase (beta-lactamase superfamily II)